MRCNHGLPETDPESATAGNGVGGWGAWHVPRLRTYAASSFRKIVMPPSWHSSDLRRQSDRAPPGGQGSAPDPGAPSGIRGGDLFAGAPRAAKPAGTIRSVGSLWSGNTAIRSGFPQLLPGGRGAELLQAPDSQGSQRLILAVKLLGEGGQGQRRPSFTDEFE
ncbi:hypothetical protein GCM10022380_19750 [Amycolatopsis tucumanensis]|uniref:Uncharacterized protein n=1 Tax=Amycolatopsis tucumanensis TaxID=401106 RepID=A0ABP7HR16_9PSEU